jgi:hypothetical protein
VNLNNVTSKARRPSIQIKPVIGIGQKCLFDTGAGLTCTSLKALRKIGKNYNPFKINARGTKVSGACGNALFPTE